MLNNKQIGWAAYIFARINDRWPEKASEGSVFNGNSFTIKSLGPNIVIVMDELFGKSNNANQNIELLSGAVVLQTIPVSNSIQGVSIPINLVGFMTKAGEDLTVRLKGGAELGDLSAAGFYMNVA